MDNFNQDEFEKWADLWDQALKSDDFKEDGSGFSIPTAHQNVGMNTTPQDFYWNNLESNADQMLTEEETPNPVYPDSIGKDQDNPKPAWVKEDLVEEISDLKRKLYDLEVKLGKEYGGGEKWVEKCHHPKDQDLLSQIEKLKTQIDNVSNSLGTEDETKMSQWNVGDQGAK